jgi:hypothetical protein
MRYVATAVLLAVAILTTAASRASAQSAIVDLSKPEPGTSRFVLNADMTPAALGVVAEPEKPTPVAAVSRVPACGEGCKLEQPVVVRQSAYGRSGEPGSNRSGTAVIAVSKLSGNKTEAAKPAATPRMSVRGRRR